MKSLRSSTLESIGLGSPLSIFKAGRMPVDIAAMVDAVFGPAGGRGALVISGGNGIVGSGKAMQLGARLMEYGVPLVTLDLPDAPAGLRGQWNGLRAAFGNEKASELMSNVVQMSYDGRRLPSALKGFKPRFILEAIPEILSLKRAHYAMLRDAYPGVEIRSVTSGFPNSELGVGILHPSFPHPINKVWEVIEDKPSDITRMLWAMGLIPIPVADRWSFVLDVLFCGITLATVRYHHATNMPFWKLDKYVRRLVGPNPVRAHDAIGPGASFLTWSCLHHLSEVYGAVFEPAPELVRRKNSGEAWYSSNRPTVDWTMADEDEFNAWLLGPLFQMTSLMLHEKRASLPAMNAIGELCAQFTRGINAFARGYGADRVVKIVKSYHKLHPAAAKSAWYPKAFAAMDAPDWRYLYVNAEHDGRVGVITISRESLNWDVVNELNAALDWLKAEGIKRVILSHDFHFSTQLVGADTGEFFPALDDADAGARVAGEWSRMARRFHDEFEVSVGFIGGKRCLGGMLELMTHCHCVVSVHDAQLGFPEVTLPVVPGMEGCHWPLRKADAKGVESLLQLLLSGKSRPAKDTVGWLTDFAGTMDDALQTAWAVAAGGKHKLTPRKMNSGKVTLPKKLPELPPTSPTGEAARKAIWDAVSASCAATVAQALEIQAKHSAGFMLSKECRRGAVGSAKKKVMEV